MLYQLINDSSRFRNILVALALLSGSWINPIVAAQTGDSTTIIFYGKLIKTTVCNLNNGKMITVDLGNVGIMKVSGGNYIKDIDYTLDCTNVSDTSVVDMTLLGYRESWDTLALPSDIAGLGARILCNGSPLQIQKPVDIATGTTPKLQVQLVTQSGMALEEKPFNITGTLLVSYK